MNKRALHVFLFLASIATASLAVAGADLRANGEHGATKERLISDENRHDDSVPISETTKKPLNMDAIASWKRITETVLSPDGNWIAYKIEPWIGDSTITLYNRNGKKRFEYECGKQIRITDDSRFLVFMVEPKRDLVRRLKLRKTPHDQMPGDNLGIYDIRSGKLDWIEDVHNHKIHEDGSGWLAYQVKTSKGGSKTDRRLYLRNLDSGETRSWPGVTEYIFAKKAGRLFYISTGDGQKIQPGIYSHDSKLGHTRSIIEGHQDYRRLISSNAGNELVFLVKPKAQIASSGCKLYLWTDKSSVSPLVLDAKGLPQNWRIGENSRVFFSADDRRLFFGTASIRLERDASILDEEYPEVDVWHGGESVQHGVQLVNRNRDLGKTYLAMCDLTDGKLMQIETPAMPESQLLDNGNADKVLLHSTKPYELQSMWNPMRYDAYLLDLRSGERKMIVKGVRDRVEPSPQGKYLSWFNYSDYSYYTYRVDTGEIHRVSDPSVIHADNESNTTFDYHEPYGLPVWLVGDRAMLIYDRYDIWRVDPENQRKPVNLTRNGRKTRTVYRLMRLDRNQDALDEKKDQYLLGVNEVSRWSGYYQGDITGESAPKPLLRGPYRLSEPLKAENSETVVYTKETFNTFPDLHASDLGFDDSVRISDVNPQQAEYSWGTAELYRWTSLDGRQLEGILHKPENFDPSRKYPMIVQFFHKSSDQLFHYRTPEYHRSRIDYHYFVSNGYIVFTPDIYFDPGYVGESAFKSIMPGVTSLIDKGFVDPRCIGAQGHSYSGYQTAYLATRTNLFACIEAGAPVVNFFSAYGGIRWESGRSRAAQYEHDQTLATPWEAPMRFLENSPLFAMDKVATPILIVHNDRDGAVPWSQGIEYFLALRRLQKPVWMLTYNGEGHTIQKMNNRRDFQVRLSQYFGHYLKGEPMPKWMREGVPAVDKDRDLGYEVERP